MSESADTEPLQPPAPRPRAAVAAGLLALGFGDGEDEGGEELEALNQQAGDQIGRYRLVKQLGEGGFGIVWQAEQTLPIRREVALKIIRPGMDSRAVIARFRAEQRALERMEHPNIAAVLDAGATEQGRPYFVMELVRGRAITYYCEEKDLSLRARLELFIDVCRAVQHAHQKAVMHRDLKPSNILVAEQDGKPVPKVIDFGIAKALTDDVDGLGSLAYTAQGMVLGTPQYMAPEQAVLGGGDMDIRVDVYSLGAILYELLAGSPPMILNRSSRTSVDKLLKRIHDEEADPPSVRALQRLAQQKGMPQLAAQLKGDLDWIVLKALEKDPERRYSTASVLAEELQRYLNNEPVQAGPPDTWYRLQKLVRRNRPVFISGTVIVLSLVAATIVSIHAFVQQSKARRRAEASERMARNESEKALGVVSFLSELLAQAGALVDQGKNPEALRLALDQSAERLNALQGQPELQAQLSERLAAVYAAMGDQGRALPLYYKQAGCLKILYGAADPRTLKAQLNCAYGEADQGEKPKALALCDEIIRQWEAGGRRGTGDWFDAMSQRAILLGRMGRNREALAEMRKLTGFKNSSGVPASESTGFLRRLAELQGDTGDFAGAEASLRLCLQLLPTSTVERTRWARHSTLLSLAHLEAQQKKHAAAAQHFEETIRLAAQMRGAEYHPLIEIWIDAARQYVADQRFAEAFHATDEALSIARVNGTDEKLPHALRACSEVRQQGHKLEEALAFRRECVEAERRSKPAGTLWIYDHQEVARLLLSLGRLDEAQQMTAVLWQETQANEGAWSDDGFVISMCQTLIEACHKWQAAQHSSARQTDIELWTAKVRELEAKAKTRKKA